MRRKKRSMAGLCFMIAVSACMAACGTAQQTQTHTSGTNSRSELHETGADAADKAKQPQDAGTDLADKAKEPQDAGADAADKAKQPQDAGADLVDKAKEPQDAGADAGAGTTQAEGADTAVLKRMVMFEKKLYVETGETSSLARCGNADGQVTSAVSADRIPAEDGQSNFGTGYSIQYGTRKNRIEVCIDGTWQIFAYNENNFHGVSMEVAKNTSGSATLKIANTTGLHVQYGDDYELEVKDDKTGEWSRVPYIIDNYGFNDIAYKVQKDVPAKWEVDWTVFHGDLGPGNYRIVKKFMDFRGTGNYTEYTLMAGFTVS